MTYAQQLSIPSDLDNAVISIQKILLSNDGTQLEQNANIIIDGETSSLTLKGSAGFGPIGSTNEVTMDGPSGSIDASGTIKAKDLEAAEDLQVGEDFRLIAYACEPEGG